MIDVADLYAWRALLRTGAGPKSPATRSVLLTLNLFLDKEGRAFPSTKVLSCASGLSERSVCTHLENAVSDGWLQKESAGIGGKGWKRNSYSIAIPEGTEPDSAPIEVKALNHVQHANEEGTEPGAEGTEPHDIKALNHVQSKSTKKSTKKSLGVKRALPDDFSISQRVKDWADENGHTRLDDHLENFKLRCQAHGYKYKNHDAAFMTAIRENWAKVQDGRAAQQPKTISEELF